MMSRHVLSRLLRQRRLGTIGELEGHCQAPISGAMTLLLLACASSPAPPLSPVGAVTSSLRAVAAAQEKYFTDPPMP